ncbi:hypothetical protein [Cellulomonas sp.]|uniref:hypothetical protein n=1 Tax=Cellulomonas sp. TaxID=40001 RepID=UPI001B14AF82|nr:hypothetical protein [Cellulomonas sp.]MBO9554709.1 hypothetical protein [Cellulomonas sp.]
MRTGSARWVGVALMAVGVVALSLNAWRGLADGWNPGTLLVALVLVAVILGGVALAMRWGIRRGRSRHEMLAAELSDWTLHEGWADASLQAQLARAGRWERGLRSGTRLTIGWSSHGFAVWSGPRTSVNGLVAEPWSGIASVTVGTGVAASTPRPALVVETVAGATLVVVPCARPGGGLLPAPREAVAELVEHVRAARDVAGAQR